VEGVGQLLLILQEAVEERLKLGGGHHAGQV
jgi:hypothetical protein